MVRPGLAEALASIKAGDAEVLLVPRLDRLARKLTIQEAVLAQVWKLNGVVIAADQGEGSPRRPRQSHANCYAPDDGVFAQLERSMIVARLRRGRQMKRAVGGYAVGCPPYGYRAVGGTLVAIAEEQKAIKLARRLKKEGFSLRQIGERLHSGFGPRSGGRWHPMMVSCLVNDLGN